MACQGKPLLVAKSSLARRGNFFHRPELRVVSQFEIGRLAAGSHRLEILFTFLRLLRIAKVASMGQPSQDGAAKAPRGLRSSARPRRSGIRGGSARGPLAGRGRRRRSYAAVLIRSAWWFRRLRFVCEYLASYLRPGSKRFSLLIQAQLHCIPFCLSFQASDQRLQLLFDHVLIITDLHTQKSPHFGLRFLYLWFIHATKGIF
jgi:hypothetical protein